MERRPCVAELRTGEPCPDYADYRNVIPICVRHLRAIGAWYAQGGGLSALYNYERMGPSSGICEAPADYCRNRISHRHPQFRMCTEHLAQIYATLQAESDALKAKLVAEDAARLAVWTEAARVADEKRRLQRAADPGTIYYLRIGGEYKIGWTSHLLSRLRQYPPTAEVLATEPGSRQDELALHRRFKQHRIAGREWYRRSGAISRHIKAVAETHGAWDPRPPIRVNPTTPQERQAESMRWVGKGTGPAA